MLMEALCADWVKLKTTNFTDAAFGTLKSTLTMPTGSGVLDMGLGGALTDRGLRAKFFGTNANNLNFNVRIWGWDRWADGSGGFSWENTLLAQLAVTLGNLAGAAGCAIAAADFEADTIAVTYGNANVSIEAVSPANDVRGAHVVVDTKGSRLVQFEFDRNSSASSANALIRRM